MKKRYFSQKINIFLVDLFTFSILYPNVAKNSFNSNTLSKSGIS